MRFLNLNKLGNFENNFSFKVHSMEKQWRNTVAVYATDENGIWYTVMLPRTYASTFDMEFIDKVNNGEIIFCIKYNKSMNDINNIYLKLMVEENGYMSFSFIEINVNDLDNSFERSNPIRKPYAKQVTHL